MGKEMGIFLMGIPPEEKRENTEKGPAKVYTDVRATPPREFPIKKEDGEKHGFTRGCGGCSIWFRGLGRQDHNEACMEMFRNLLEVEKRIRNYEERMMGFEEEQEAKRHRKLDRENKKITKRLEKEDRKREREQEE